MCLLCLLCCFLLSYCQLSYDMASIVYCELQEEKGNGRATFKVLHDTGNDFKTHEFEADTDIASKFLLFCVDAFFCFTMLTQSPS